MLQVAIVAVQLLLAILCICCTIGADKLEGVIFGLENLASGLAVLILFVGSAASTDGSTAATPDSLADGNVTVAAAVNATGGAEAAGGSGTGDGYATSAVHQDIALVVQLSAVIIPLMLTLYDNVLLPLIGACTERDENGARDCCGGLKSLFSSCLFTPIDIVLAFFSDSMGSQLGNVVSALHEVDRSLEQLPSA